MQIDFEILKKIVVLYVEDEPELRNATALGLKKVCKEVLIAPNGEEAMKLFQMHKDKINVIISDIQMPIKDGIELSREIKASHPNIPIILVTAFSDSDHLFQAIELKINNYLKKPVDLITMYEVIQKEILPYFTAIELEQKNNAIKRHLADLEFFKQSVSNYVLISKTDEQGIITDVNEMFCDISGYEKNELIGKSHNIIRHPDVPKYFFKKMWETLQSGKNWHGIIKNRSKNGNDYFVDSFIKPVFDENGNITSFFSIRFDITAQEEKKKDIEQKLFHQMHFVKENEQKLNKEFSDKFELLLSENKRLKSENSELKMAFELSSTKKNQYVEIEDKKQIMQFETAIGDLEAELAKARNQVRLLTTAKINNDQEINKFKEEIEKLKKDKRHLNETLQEVLDSVAPKTQSTAD